MREITCPSCGTRFVLTSPHATGWPRHAPADPNDPRRKSSIPCELSGRPLPHLDDFDPQPSGRTDR